MRLGDGLRSDHLVIHSWLPTPLARLAALAEALEDKEMAFICDKDARGMKYLQRH